MTATVTTTAVSTAASPASTAGRRADTARPRRGVTALLWTGQALFAAMFAFAALPKLSGDPAAIEGFAQIGFGDWFVYAIGACELAGAIGLLIPRLAGLAATALVGLMIGATVVNLFVVPGAAPMAAVTAVFCVLLALIARGRARRGRRPAAAVAGRA